ncbi:hypothetical protein FHS42_000550 [Streptomyces zagrosensis]|uniref:Uncharacterized protein n=1 Tax=Streptomyces zagrosensis TaxID=1042984 RepID=A0A7W9Q6N2_9ACTN|nr:hypothetical protein [Streptomyces zagrosensis]
MMGSPVGTGCPGTMSASGFPAPAGALGTAWFPDLPGSGHARRPDRPRNFEDQAPGATRTQAMRTTRRAMRV